jgi:hypothetical protein
MRPLDGGTDEGRRSERRTTMAGFWKTREDIDITEIDDGFVAYDESRDRVHHLNHSAAMIFALADGTRSEAEIAELLGEHFKLDAPPVEEVRTVLQQFADEGLATLK